LRQGRFPKGYGPPENAEPVRRSLIRLKKKKKKLKKEEEAGKEAAGVQKKEASEVSPGPEKGERF